MDTIYKGFTIKLVPAHRNALGHDVYRIFNAAGAFCDWDRTEEAARHNIDTVLRQPAPRVVGMHPALAAPYGAEVQS